MSRTKEPAGARYTPAILQTISECRQAGMTWANVGIALGWGTNAASSIRDYLHGQGVSTKKVAKPERMPTERERLGNDPLPSGHPLALAVLASAPPL